MIFSSECPVTRFRYLRYLSYSYRPADLLFELISRRYEQKSTVFTTNRAFKEWLEVFPNAACVVSLIDRLVHRCDILPIEGESYRLKEAMVRGEQKAAARTAAPRKGKKA
jgi:DNA replication protein DnaC